jgi:hypothetical protein
MYWKAGTDWDVMATLICNDIALGKAYLHRIHCPWMMAGHLDHLHCRVLQVTHESLKVT